MRRILVVLIALVMIPIFMGILCPCAMAAPSGELAIQKMQCQGCCPEMAKSSQCDAEIAPASQAISFRDNLFATNVLKALCPRESQGIAINRRALVPAGDEPSSISSPLFQSLQVLRI